MAKKRKAQFAYTIGGTRYTLTASPVAVAAARRVYARIRGE
jgi:hypothetical protein